jgi:hypothetical protein
MISSLSLLFLFLERGEIIFNERKVLCPGFGIPFIISIFLAPFVKGEIDAFKDIDV